MNGRHAVDTFHEHMPHVTVIDFVMPEMDGLEAARRLIRRYPAVVILIVTADPLRQLIQDAKTAGVKGLCPKSKPDCLLKAIEALINGGTHFHQESAVASLFLGRAPSRPPSITRRDRVPFPPVDSDLDKIAQLRSLTIRVLRAGGLLLAPA